MRVGFRIAGAVLVVGATAVAADARATDLDAYAVKPGTKLMQDFFLPE